MAFPDAPHFEVISLERSGQVATLWLDRPAQRNAMGSAFFAELPVAMGQLSADPEVRAVVIAGRGPAFSVGLDLKEMGASLLVAKAQADETSAAAAGARTYAEIKRLQSSISSVANCPKPVIAAVHGWCIGAGVDLATSCDIRLAAADAKFSVRETKLAIVADLGTLQRLPAIVGRGHVAELAFTGKDVPADRALAIGLVNDVLTDAPGVQATARQLAEEIADNSPLVVQGVKHVLRASEGRSVEEALDYVAVWNSAFLHSQDLAEAVTAFAEKRSRHFTGS